MAGSIVTAEKGDRRPNWDKVPRAVLAWEFVLLWMNIDPDNPPVEIVSFVRGDTPRFESYDRRPAREALLQEFKDRMEVVLSRLAELADGAPPEKGTRRSLFNTVLDLRKGAAFFAGTAWGAPPEFLAMADEQLAKRTRTDAATSTRGTMKRDRLQDLGRFVDDVCKALNKAGHEIREIDGRKQLPQLPQVSAGDLRTLFLAQYPGRKSSRHTFARDLAKIATLKPGPKRYKANDLAEMLAGKISP